VPPSTLSCSPAYAPMCCKRKKQARSCTHRDESERDSRAVGDDR
jgi:hypothetical protein